MQPTETTFQKKNLVEPEEVFDLLGNQEFGEEWTDRARQILQGVIQKPKSVKNSFLRDKYMANKVYKKFVAFLNDPNVTIYVRQKEGNEPEKWKGVRCSLDRKYFLLIDQEIHPEHGPMDIGYMSFWIEMPKDKNLTVSKNAGAKPKHDKEHMRSIFLDVAETIEGKITHENYAYHLARFLGREDAPKSSWVGDHLSEEIKEENIKRGFA